MQFTVTGLTVLTALFCSSLGQKALPDNEVPNVGGGIYSANDPSIANYSLQYNIPFDPSVYGGYYTWAANNNTLGIDNITEIVPQPNTSNTYTFFVVNEGQPKKINLTSSSSCSGSGCEKFQKILFVIFENEVFSWTMNDSYWQVLATRGKLLTNSHAITHPSFPNYAAILAGDFFGIAAEDFYNINTTTVYDLLDAKNLDYATYAEWYIPYATSRGPNDCNQAITWGPIDNTNPIWNSPTYRRLDVPPLLFNTYTDNYNRCSKIYNATEKFDLDVFSKTLPSFSFYVPDLLHNGHDPESDSDYFHQPMTCGIWFNAFLDKYLPALEEQGVLVVATFDEATWPTDDDSVPNNDNSVATILFGAGITPNTTDDTYITHYGFLRGVEANFGLGSLGRNDTNSSNGNLYSLLSNSPAPASNYSKPTPSPLAASSATFIGVSGTLVTVVGMVWFGLVMM